LGVPKPAQVQISVKHFKSVQGKWKATEWQSLQRCIADNRENVNTVLCFDKETRGDTCDQNKSTKPIASQPSASKPESAPTSHDRESRTRLDPMQASKLPRRKQGPKQAQAPLQATHVIGKSASKANPVASFAGAQTGRD